MLKKYIYLLVTGIIFGSQFLITIHALQGYTPLEIGMMRIIMLGLLIHTGYDLIKRKRAR